MAAALEIAHYRAACKTVYLSFEDLTEPVNLTIASVRQEKNKVRPKSGELFNTVYWKEKELRKGHKLNPMILNSGNAKTLRRLTGSPDVNKWAGHVVTVYPDPNVRFAGEVVGGVRISPERPRLEKPAFDRSNKKHFERGVASYQEHGDTSQIEKHMTLTDDDRLVIEAAANEIKDAAND